MSYVHRCTRCSAEIGDKSFMWNCSTCRIQDTIKATSKESYRQKGLIDHFFDLIDALDSPKKK